jgi:ferredoxin
MCKRHALLSLFDTRPMGYRLAMEIFSGKNRAVHLGRYPVERLGRGPVSPAPLSALEGSGRKPAENGLSGHIANYYDLFAPLRDGEVADKTAPLPDDGEAVANEIKASAVFLDATAVGICGITGTNGVHQPRKAIVLAVEVPRAIEADNPAGGWTRDSGGDLAALRAGEIAISLAGYIRRLGYPAKAHSEFDTEVDLAALSVHAGVCVQTEGRLVLPFAARGFALAAIVTTYPVALDAPIKARSGLSKFFAESLPMWLGKGGVQSGPTRARLTRRATHLSIYEMEKIKRVEKTTTLIFEDEIPRVPKRAAFFERALQGDLGAKSKRERSRFAFKHPLAASMVSQIRTMVPHQRGRVADTKDPATSDPAANAQALKSLLYFLGADLAGICVAKPYTWFSHTEDGTPIEPYHKYAVVLLIDQGFDTMEGASGDDWVSGQQSMRGYMRGAEIAGIAASLIRDMGHDAASQSNALSDVLQLPLVLEAGLGELSRIGELVLNPFVGPRFKSAVITTDMPLDVDLPIDFGLQDMCTKCNKCARECPCDAIPWGDKVMFNGYEMWKPDVERCARYRLTNPYGAACGRCMKMCPYNNEGLFHQKWALWASIKWPWTRNAIIRWDDKLGHGVRNPVKKWWFDLEITEDGVVEPKGVNQRDLDLDKVLDPGKQKMAYYPASMMPPPDHGDPYPVDRKAALAAKDFLETPAEALARRAANRPKPEIYTPTPPLGEAGKTGKPVPNPYLPSDS